MRKIKINIAGRMYPLTIEDEDEFYIREAKKNIEGMIQNFEKKFAVTDKQDVLAMCALQFATKIEQLKKEQKDKEDHSVKRIENLSSLLLSVKKQLI